MFFTPVIISRFVTKFYFFTVVWYKWDIKSNWSIVLFKFSPVSLVWWKIYINPFKFFYFFSNISFYFYYNVMLKLLNTESIYYLFHFSDLSLLLYALSNRIYRCSFMRYPIRFIVAPLCAIQSDLLLLLYALSNRETQYMIQRF